MNKRLIIIFYYLKTRFGPKFLSRDRFIKWQEHKVKRHIKRVTQKSKFYNEYYHGYDIGNWKSLPTINKQIMMDNFDDLNLAGIKKKEAYEIAVRAENTRDFSPKSGNISIGLSSGTSGNRGLFIVNDIEQAQWAGTILGKMLPGSIFREHRIAFFLRANNNLYESINSKRVKFKFYDILSDQIEAHIESLNLFSPTVITAPPSILRMIACAQEKGVLSFSPQKLISVAEVLDPIDERYIEKQFGQKVHQVYQSTEGFLAATCKYGTIHINEDVVAIQKEYLDSQMGKFTPIITDFSRITQPIIRYRLNDILTEKQTCCPCGSVFTAIESIEGRTDDLFYFKSKITEKPVVIFPDFIRRAIMLSSDSISEYIATQHDYDLIRIAIKCPDEIQNSVRRQICDSINDLSDKYGCKQPMIEFIEYEATVKSKKMKRIERMFNV